MQLVDANIILRYILWDHENLAEKAKEIIEHETIELPFEVIAEVVYVLEGDLMKKWFRLHHTIDPIFVPFCPEI